MQEASLQVSTNKAIPSGERQPLLRLSGLTKSYKTREGGAVVALEDTSLSLVDGEFVSVVGPSGCGKSTLMKLIAGIIPRSAGEIFFRGQAVTRAQRGVGVVFQGPVLLPWLTVLENVLLPIKVLGMDRGPAIVRAK